MTWTRTIAATDRAVNELWLAVEGIEGQPGPGEVEEVRELIERTAVALRTLADTVDAAS